MYQFLVALSLISSVLAAPAADLVNNLPGLTFNPSFKHYSGYVQAASTRYFHYWFTESMRDPGTDPLVLWLNGGPGCSSLGGLIEELGPFHVSDNGNSVYLNQWAWNTYANVIFLESPAGVGFSYSSDGNVTVSDDDVANQNHNALLDWYNKFPEYKGRDFYFSGESYGGIYLPTLGVLLSKDKTNFPNFKGVAVGNGIISFPWNDNTMIPLFYYHGLVRDELYQNVKKTCCNGNIETCDIDSVYDNTPGCKTIINKAFSAADDLDPYNLYDFCYLSPNGPGMNKKHFIKRMIRTKVNKRMEWAPKMRVKRAVTNNDADNTTLPLCAQEDNTYNYLNRDDVRKALHIPTSLPRWTDCSNSVGNHYHTIYDNMTQQVNTILAAGIRMLFYNGDVDTVCNHVMNMKFLSDLNLSILGAEKVNQLWHYQGALKDINAAGTHMSYQGGLDFLTVRGSGHFVPEDRPREALQMIYNFINNKDYSTAVPG
ncbi:hypothetical protein WR25_05023 [Diploscapter pachys]|uniref:Carboxypeptidase n=1 Tax=Diploscapter pachys TaxID=2018661 RepID=A0A2A2J5A8_9BILA|nr:hypothetical protein WR25_05023 [Diploscapter pachys]